MPRMARYAPGGLVYHVLNRGVGRQQLFFSDDDYLAFERVIVETLEKREMRILSYCSMPNHWLCRALHNTGTSSSGLQTTET